ncbi:hypothetical protein KAU11_10095 [Candidatus Babeliales bacterium]|nr:hypothetical protein [Candidatus Babeliales bacterium]
MADEIMHFATIADMEAASAEGQDGAQEVVTAILSGQVQIGDEQVQEQNLVEEVADEEQEQSGEEPKISAPNVSDDLQDDQPEIDFEAKLAAFKSGEQTRYAEMQLKYEEQIASKNKELEEIKTPQIAQVEEIKLELGDEDIDLATGFEKNTRKLTEELLAKISNGSTLEIAEKVAAIERRQDEYYKAKDDAAKEKKTADDRLLLYNELDEVSGKYATLKLPKPVSDMHSEIEEFKGVIEKTLKLGDAAETEKAYRRIVRGDSALGKTLLKKLGDAKIEIPDGASNYLNLTELHERRLGKVFDAYAGKFKPIVDRYGTTSYLPSIEDAYKLSHLSEIVVKAGQTESLEIQRRLEEQQNAAVVLDESVTGSASGQQEMTEGEMNALMTMDPDLIKKNPQLTAQYVKLCEIIGMKVPTTLIKKK